METQWSVVTRTDLTEGLRAIGLKTGDVACVHSSLSSLGMVIGGARTVIESLMEVVTTEGAILMPTYSGDLSDPAEWRYPPVPEESWQKIRDQTPPFDPVLTPTRKMGAIPELFRHFPRTRRSPHPQSSFTAWGKHRDYLVERHPLDHRFGINSPLGRLLDLRGKVLLLGAPWVTISAFYLLYYEAAEPKIIRKRSPVLIDGKSHWVEYSDLVTTSCWFPDAAQFLVNNGLATEKNIGPARSLLFDLAPALVSLRKWVQEKNLLTPPTS